MTEWHRDETFWRTFAPFMFPSSRIDAAAEEIEQVLALTGIDRGKVLDMGCGPGRHAIELARRGFEVTAVDSTPCLLRTARERAGAAEVDVEWVLGDMRDFARPASYDLVISIFTSFGYFRGDDENTAVLESFRRNLRPGGLCLIELIPKETLARIFQPAGATPLPGGAVVFEQREVSDDWSRLRVAWTLVEGDAATRFELDHAIYSAQELKDRMRAVGFGSVRCFGGLGGDPFGPESRRLAVVGGS